MIEQKILEESILAVTINTGKGNALSFNEIKILLDVVNKVYSDEQIKGLILSGTGQSFCTGLKSPDYKDRDYLSFFASFDQLLFQLFSLSKPLVVASPGHSIGGGLLIQLCADFVIMANNEKIKIGLPELAIGIPLDDLMINVLEYSVGNNRAIQEILYSSQYMNPSRAINYSLCDILTDKSSLSIVAVESMQRMLLYDEFVFSTMKYNLRKRTITRMQESLSKQCYNVYLKRV